MKLESSVRRVARCPALLLLSALACFAGEPVRTAWILGPADQPGLSRILPDVRSVRVEDEFVVVRSAGISLQYLGPLQAAPRPEEKIHEFVFRIPRHPVAEAGKLARVPVDIVGAFLNGVPVYNQFESVSYNAANLWHYDPVTGTPGLLEALAAQSGRPSPLIGFALDGFPIYGPWARDALGGLRRMRSSYRQRAIATRHVWPDGTELTPEQYGPNVSESDPPGRFAEDYEYVAGSGDLDECNGAWAKTPEYPEGTYAYFLTSTYPYLVGPKFHGKLSVPAEAEFKPLTVRPSFAVSASTVAVKAGEPVRFRFAAPGRHFEYVHERPIHLLIASEDLAEFDHIHPELTANDHYEVAHTFARGGRYRLWADFSLPGGAPRVESFDVDVAGPRTAAPVASAAWAVKLAPEQALRAGVDIPIHLKLPAGHADLQPYLGAWAHVIVISKDRRSFAHAHPLEAAVTMSAVHTHVAAGPPPDEVTIVTSFPRAGEYRLWAQFQRAGKVITVPFVLQVAAGAQGGNEGGPGKAAVPAEAIRIKVSQNGYTPARVSAPAGRPLTLAFTRDDSPNCGGEVVFPSLGIRAKLPANETVLVNLPALPEGEIRFACGMGMYRGMILAETYQ